MGSDARGLFAVVVLLSLLVLAPAGSAAPPVADFAVSPDPPNQGSPATYDAILQGAGVDSTVEWDFDGDGAFDATGPSVQHTHVASGDADVTMRATDEGESTTVTRTLTVNARPVVTLGFNPLSPAPGEPILFAAEVVDPDGDALSAYAWDFGDGATASDTVPTHSYAGAGARTVSLAVTDARGAVGSGSVAVDVRDRPPPPPPPDEPRFIEPFPIVRLVGRVVESSTVVTLLGIRAPEGSLVRVRCRGEDCPRRSMRRRVPGSGRVRFPGFERSLAAGTRLSVFVRHGDEVGKYTRFAIRRGKRPRRTDLCLLPGRRAPLACDENLQDARNKP